MEAAARAVALQPLDPAAHFRLGMALVRAGAAHEALHSLERAATLAGPQPVAYVAWMNLGNVRSQMLGDVQGALPYLERAIQLDPTQPQPYFNLGHELQRLDRYCEAAQRYREAAATAPAWHEPALALASTTQRLMAWADWPLTQRASRTLLREHGASGFEQPFLATFEQPFAPEDTLRIMRAQAEVALAKAGVPAVERRRPRRAAPLRLDAGEPLRVAVSHTHPFKGSQVAPHYAAMFGAWRSATSTLSAFSLAQRLPLPSDESGAAWRAAQQEGRVQLLVDHPDDDEALARFCRSSRRPHLAVVSSAYGECSALHVNRGADREALFWRRCAPVQMCWFDWPSSTGQSWIDYYASDRKSIPPITAAAAAFSERLVLLPHSWYVTGHSEWARLLTDSSKASLLEPWSDTSRRKGFVFTNRNLPQKCDPETADGWASIMRRTASASSSLWLYASPEEARSYQHAELLSRGVHANRIKSTGKIPRAAHIAMMSQAQLWLDTVNYNAHGTGSDVIWGALPPVILSGNKVASKSFASMACAAAACMTSVKSRKEYDDIAVSLALANNPT